MLFLKPQKNVIFGEHNLLNGKIVAECDYEVDCIYEYPWDYGYITTSRNDYENIEKECCLSREDLKHYLGDKIGKAIYIKNLRIFDKPKELDDYVYLNGYNGHVCKIMRAPQNMMHVYSREAENYILISIHPEYLCKVLNGECTIIVKKKVLKEMVGNDK